MLAYPAPPPRGQPLFKYSIEVYLVLLHRCGLRNVTLYDTRTTL